jgi:uncharacterized protein
MNRFVFRWAATCLALGILAAPAMAQQAPAAAQPTAQHMAIAKEAAVGSGVTGSYDAIIEDVIRSLGQMNVARPEIRDDLKAVADMLRPELEQQKQQLIDNTARIFANRMTESELQDVAAFFKSPSGQKYVQSQPLVVDDVMREISNWTQNVSEFVMIRARAEMAKRGHQLQ